MTRMTGPDCAVVCNLINANTHTHTHTYSVEEVVRSIFVREGFLYWLPYYTINIYIAKSLRI